jgi:hypothetical protein
MAPFTLVFVTGNPGKLDSAREVLGTSFNLESAELDLPEIQGTLEDIAREKCRRAANVVSIFGVNIGARPLSQAMTQSNFRLTHGWLT